MMRTTRAPRFLLLAALGLFLLAPAAALFSRDRPQQEQATYSQLIARVERDPASVAGVVFNPNDQEIVATLVDGREIEVNYPSAEAQIEFQQLLERQDVLFDSKGTGSSALGAVLRFLLPLILVIGLFIFLMSRMQRQGGGSAIMSFGKSRAKRMAPDSPKITFKDVAGVDEAVEELQEIKEFLADPKRFQALGARIPKGVLLYGAPGTGKTLLARAVAGEAGAAFFSISGSDFVEMFVGVGASRVRDLFAQAKQAAPSIIFMDEIDAVGRHRGAGLGGGHDEREQTLNQLLVEMDGFELSDNVILIAATNRPDVLDPALLRPGRFDRQIVVDRPDRNGRRRILEVHTKGKLIDSSIDLDTLAAGTPGFTGADLANLVNEAALLAARRQEDDQEPGARGRDHARHRGPGEEDAPPLRARAQGDRLPRDGACARGSLPRAHRRRAQDLDHLAGSRPGADRLASPRGSVPDDPLGPHGPDGDDARRARRRGARLPRGHDRRRQRHREGDGDGQAHGHALRHEREAGTAGARPQPRHALPGPGHGRRARLLGGDRARDRRRDPPGDRGGARAGAPGARGAPRGAPPPLRAPDRARDDRQGPVRAAARRRLAGQCLPRAGAESPARGGEARAQAARPAEAASLPAPGRDHAAAAAQGRRGHLPRLDPGRIGDWVPSLAGSTLEDDYRACTTQEGSQIAERILEHSDEGRYYVYEITDSPLPLRSYRSRLAVHGHRGHSHVDWEAEFEAESPDLEPELASDFSQIYRDGLATLRDRLEAARAD